MHAEVLKNKYIKVFLSIFAGGAAYVINYIISFILTPFITDSFGTEAYGFVSLARQFTQYAAILTVALSSFAARHIAVEYYHKSREKANIYYSSAFYGELTLSTVIFIIGIAAIPFLEKILSLPSELKNDIKILFFFVFLSFWTTSSFNVFECWAYIKNRLELANIFKGLSYIAQASVLFVCYRFCSDKLYFVGAGLLASSVVTASSNYWFSKKNVPELEIKRSEFSLRAVKKLLLDGIWTSVNSLGEVLNHGLDLLVCNLLLSPVSMGQVAIAKTITTIFGSIFSIINPSFQPMMLKSYSKGDKKALLSEMGFAMKISGMLANIGFAGFYALGLSYYRLWIPNQDTELIYKITVISLLTLIPGGPMQPLYYIYTLTVKKKFSCIVTILGGIFNVVSMYLLITYTDLGIYAVVWTTALVMAVINFITNPLYMAHVLHMPLYSFYTNIIRNVIACGAITGIFKMLSNFYMPDNWCELILTALIYCLIGMIVHLMIVLNRQEWTKVRKLTSRG